MLTSAPGAPISDDLAATFAQKFIEFFEGRQPTTADRVFVPFSISPLPFVNDDALRSFKAYIADFCEAAPDFRRVQNESIIANDRLMLRVAYVGTQTRPLFGSRATGKKITLNCIGVFRFNKVGLAVENWLVIEVAGMMAQIGAFPASAA